MGIFISDPKLKQAREEIEAICKRYDIAGLFILHNWPGGREQGKAEHFMCVSPSYSKLSMEGPDQMRIRSKLADYNGDREAQKRDMEATLNLLSLFASTAAQVALPLLELSRDLDARMGAVHTPVQVQPDPPKGSH